ncbi:MAG: sulfurtransferase [Bacteroidales bacterium]|jgi:thiosulfate/3-mercaptopyruvate sulfurtransferase|nr:sulfurtransferase [Bacteroidales bacterium]
MKRTSVSMILAVLFLFISQVLTAQVLVSAKDFTAELKKDKSMVVIDANTAENYDKSHVMGAVNVPHKELYKDGEIEGLIKSPADLAAYFGEKGISNTSNIVIYDDGSNKYSSRVYWILDYLGASNLRILHKDMDEWKAARLPITRNKATLKATTFTPKVNATILATEADVKGCSGNCVVVDSRHVSEYNGTSEKPVSVGHIKGAVNVEYKEFLDDKGAFKSPDQLKAVASKNGLTSDKNIILYCQTSVRAAAAFVALKEILGYPNVKVYDGAYNEWKANGGAMEK